LGLLLGLFALPGLTLLDLLAGQHTPRGAALRRIVCSHATYPQRGRAVRPAWVLLAPAPAVCPFGASAWLLVCFQCSRKRRSVRPEGQAAVERPRGVRDHFIPRSCSRERAASSDACSSFNASLSAATTRSLSAPTRHTPQAAAFRTAG